MERARRARVVREDGGVRLACAARAEPGAADRRAHVHVHVHRERISALGLTLTARS